MLGSFLLEPVRTGVRLFDRTYNGRPWLLSLLCGLSFATALALWQDEPMLAYALGAVALVSFALDAIGMTASFYAWARKRR
jgi:hypothetical protein